MPADKHMTQIMTPGSAEFASILKDAGGRAMHVDACRQTHDTHNNTSQH
jgi:hypothetical protein